MKTFLEIFRKPQLSPRLLILVLCALSNFVGCRTFSEKENAVAQYEKMREQQRWWDKNRHRAQYVSGRGYFLPDTNQYYNGEGQPIADAGEPVQAASFETEENFDLPQPDVEDPDKLNRLDPRNIVKQIKRATGKGPSRQRARENFQKAESTYREALNSDGEARQRKLQDAAKLYASAATNWPNSAIEENAMFKVGECYYFVDEYSKANDGFGKLLKSYPNTRYLDLISARRFKIAEYWLNEHIQEKKRRLQLNLTDHTLPRLDSFGHAVKLFDRIRIDDPAGKLADDATIAAANAHFRAGKYRRAEELYADLRQAFPDSKHQFEAHLLGLKCHLLNYQGPNYDPLMLKEADQLAKQIKRQFRQQYVRQREMIDRTHAEVHARLAEQDWNRAQYYQRRGEYRGAQHYYDKIISSFPTTDIARSAREQVAKIDDKAQQPPARLSSMWKYFDDRNEDLPALKSERTDTIMR